jgi:hypothetical protein
LAKIKKESFCKTAKDVEFYKKLHILGFSDYRNGNITRTNLDFISRKSGDLITNKLIEEANSFYNKIVHIQDEYVIQDED